MATEQMQPTPARRAYPSDLTDGEWDIIASILNAFDPPCKTGRRRDIDLREVLNAIFYLNKTGCPWRYLPHDFSPSVNINYYYNKWTRNGTLEAICVRPFASTAAHP